MRPSAISGANTTRSSSLVRRNFLSFARAMTPPSTTPMPLSMTRPLVSTVTKETAKGSGSSRRATLAMPRAWRRSHGSAASTGRRTTGRAWHGNRKADPNEDAEVLSWSPRHVLSNYFDFAHEKSALTRLVESRGHILRMCVKGHPELAGVGTEYSWGKAKQKFRRDVNDRKPRHLRRNVIKCFSREDECLPVARVRKFGARRVPITAAHTGRGSQTPMLMCRSW